MLVAATGAVAAYLAVSGRFLDYLKPGMRLPLLAAGLVMVTLGALTLVRAGRRSSRGLPPLPEPPPPPGFAAPLVTVHHDLAAGPGHSDGGDHGDHGDHGRVSVAWLLVLPLLALVLIQPSALGADAARRDDSERLPASPAGGFAPLLPPRDGAVDLTLFQYMGRSYFDEQESLAGATLRLTGFVVGDPDIADGYRLTRFRMSCCAADAFAVQVVVRGLASPPPPDDSWVEVVGEWVPPADPDASGAHRGATIRVDEQTPIDPPSDPYE